MFGSTQSSDTETPAEDAPSRRRFLKGLGTAAAAGGVISSPGLSVLDAEAKDTAATGPALSRAPSTQVAADPTDVPPPADWSVPRTHQITLTCEEVTAEIEPGVEFSYMTFDGQVPGPMIRVRQGDTVEFTLENAPASAMPHNIDFHAVYGTGGGAEATMAPPGNAQSISFRAEYPGAFIYHCAVPNLDYHISSGMFGLIFVEPEEGLPPVDREFYLGQQEVYTDKPVGEDGSHAFDFEAMAREDPTYVLLNGQKHALTESAFGTMTAEVDETARVFFVNGGPNLTSSFHPIGNVWTKAWREGAIASEPERHVQTMTVAPGSCGVFEMNFPVPETIKLVDHALSRVVRKGFLGEITVEGKPKPDIFDPDPTAA
ncbi:MAG: copper-containing nitrite reductase [Salinibacter sp.]